MLPYRLETILKDMREALAARFYYPALSVALTLPDICAGLQLDRSIFVKEKHYVSFVDSYSSPRELGVDGQQCYRLRGGLIHRGNARGHAYFEADYVVFTVPESGSPIHALTMDAADGTSAVMIDLPMFCAAMEVAVRRWFETNQSDQNISKNARELLSFRPEGAPPIVVGRPVLASCT